MQNNGLLGYFWWFWAIILHTLGVQAGRFSTEGVDLEPAGLPKALISTVVPKSYRGASDLLRYIL